MSLLHAVTSQKAFFTDADGRVVEEPLPVLCDSCKEFTRCDQKHAYQKPQASLCKEYKPKEEPDPRQLGLFKR